MYFMRTTININDVLLERLRERSRRSRRPLTAVLDETLRRGLAADPAPASPVHIPTFRVGIKPAFRGISMNQLYDQLESEETLKIAEK